MGFGRARQVPATCSLVGVLVAVGHQVALGATLPFPTATQRLTGPSLWVTQICLLVLPRPAPLVFKHVDTADMYVCEGEETRQHC